MKEVLFPATRVMNTETDHSPVNSTLSPALSVARRNINVIKVIAVVRVVFFIFVIKVIAVVREVFFICVIKVIAVVDLGNSCS